MKNALRIVIGTFALSLWLGWQAPPSVAENLFAEMGQMIRPLLEYGALAIVLVIFINNALKALLAIVLGIGLGIVPLLFVAMNGYVLGAVIRMVADKAGFAAAILGLAPHGVIELPAVLLASAFGVALGWEALLQIFRRGGQVGPMLRRSLRTYLRWIAPGLAVAALIEVFVTPLVMPANARMTRPALEGRSETVAGIEANARAAVPMAR